MASSPDHISMALFCDFENVALGVRESNDEKFNIKRVLERLLLKGSIVVKKAYCDWERYKGFKAAMHEANFELIEIPHVRQSGKNSADIRLVVDALDLCYTKSHVNTFVIISGDSDFSPLVSKLRENAKYVIGVGVKQSTSDLLIANCDEFIFYDDLVRESQRNAARRDPREAPPRRSPEEEKRRREEMDARRSKAVELAVETYEALVTDRDDGGKIWASVLKEALKRRNPGFNENYYGFRTFGNLLEEAQGRGLLEFGRDEKSGTFVSRGSGVSLRGEGGAVPAPTPAAPPASIAPAWAPETPLAVPGQPELAVDGEHEGGLGGATAGAPEGGHDGLHDGGHDGNRRRRSRGGRSHRGGRAESARSADGGGAASEHATPPVAPVDMASAVRAAPSEPSPPPARAEVEAPATQSAPGKTSRAAGGKGARKTTGTASGESTGKAPRKTTGKAVRGTADPAAGQAEGPAATSAAAPSRARKRASARATGKAQGPDPA